MKKIAFLLGSKEVGGIERVVNDLGVLFGKNGYDIYYIMLISNYSPELIFPGHIISILPQGKNIFSKIIIFMKRVIKVMKIKKIYKFDAVLSFGNSANIINIITKSHETCIASVHSVLNVSNSYIGIIGKINSLMTKVIYPKTDYLVLVSKGLKKMVKEQIGVSDNKVKIIYNGINIDEIEKKADEEIEDNIFSEDKITLVNVGRLVNEKGQWHLIRIMSEIRKIIPNIQLVIVGDGYLKEPLKELVKKLRLDDCVHILGYCSNPYKYIKQSKIYVQCSISEAFSLVVVEAMTLGVPVISSDVLVGPREIIDENVDYQEPMKDFKYAKNGILTPRFSDEININTDNLSNEEVIMSNAIVSLLKDREMQKMYSKLGRKRAACFSDEIMLDKYKMIIRS